MTHQAQWAQYNQTKNPETTAKKKVEEVLDFVVFDVANANEEKIRVNQEFDDEMHESQWFSDLLEI